MGERTRVVYIARPENASSVSQQLFLMGLGGGEISFSVNTSKVISLVLQLYSIFLVYCHYVRDVTRVVLIHDLNAG